MPPRAEAAFCLFILMSAISLAICKASNLAMKCSSENKAIDVGAALINAANGSAGVVEDVLTLNPPSPEQVIL